MLDLVRRLLALALVLHAAGLVLRPLLGNLLQEVAVFGRLLERELLLVLLVELDEHVTARDVAPGSGEPRDDQRLASAAGLKRDRYDVRPRGLRQTGDTERAHELAWAEGAAARLGEGRRSGAASPDGARRHTANTAAASRHPATDGPACPPEERRTPVGCPPASLPAEMDMADLGSAQYRRRGDRRFRGGIWLAPAAYNRQTVHAHTGRPAARGCRRRAATRCSGSSSPAASTTCAARRRSTRPRGSRAARRRGAAQARGPAAGLQLQAARRLQQDRAPAAGRARARRDRRERRQPRAGRRVLRAAARHPAP